METLRIALVELLAHSKPSGGFIALSNLAEALSNRGHEVHVLLGSSGNANFSGDSLISYWLKKLQSSTKLHVIRGYHNLYNIPKMLKPSRKVLSKLNYYYRFDVLHFQGLSGLFMPSDFRSKSVVTIHGNNIYRGLTLLRHTLKDAIAFNNLGNLADDVLGSFGYWALEKQVCKTARLIIALTKSEALLLNKYYNVSKSKIRVIPNPVLLQKESKDDINLLSSKESKILLTVSPLTLMKGIHLIVKATKHVFSHEKKAVHIFVGSGPLHHIIESLANEFPKRVIQINSISSKLYSIYSAADLLVHGSLYESQGLVLGEAMLSEKPIVAFGIPSISECVLNGVTGFLANPFNAIDLANKVLFILENADKARQMGINGKRRAQELYDPAIISQKLENIYKEAMTQ